MASKKPRERAILDLVRQHYPAFPAGQITEGESPDFVVGESTDAVGIELAEYVRGQSRRGRMVRKGSPMRAHEDQAWLVALEARKVYERTHTAPLYVTLSWAHEDHTSRPLNKSTEIPALAQAVAALVSVYEPAKLFHSARLGWHELTPDVRKHVHSVHITRVRGPQQVLWGAQEGGLISVAPEEIQALIDFKQEKLGAYRRACPSVWLLIAAVGEHVSSMLDLDERLREHTFTSAFDPVLVFDRWHQEVLELALRPPRA